MVDDASSNNKMIRAIQVSAVGDVSALTLKNIPKPSPDPSQVLVQNAYSGINFIDTYHRSGLYKLPLPFVPGREGSGKVVQVGSQVTGFKVGDKVCYTSSATYAEFTSVNAEFCVKLPDSFNLEIGAAMLLQGLTAMVLTRQVHEVLPGDTVLVHAAAGGTGMLITQLCKLKGAKVIGTTSTLEKKELALKGGCDHVILYKNEDILEHVTKFTDGKMVNVVFDGVGKSTFDISLKCLKKLGSMVSFGNASGKVDDIDIMKLVPNCIRLSRPSLFQLVKTGAEFKPLAEELVKLFDDGKLTFHVSKVYNLSDVASAHTDLEGQKTTGKIILDCSK